MIKAMFLGKVKDFSTWKKGFDELYQTRRKYGEKSFSVGTIHGQPNNFYIITEWDNVEKCKTWINSPERAEAMKKYGVIDNPSVTFLDEVHQEAYHAY
jgi:heme-degrading monooxygenase HmoA